MVVGDRLWLFSQTPNVPHPQPLLLPNDASTAFRNFSSTQSIPPSPRPSNPSVPMQSPRMPLFPNHLLQCNSMLNTDSTSNYDLNKTDTYYRQFLSPQSNAAKFNTADGYFPPNQPKLLFNKLLWSNTFMNKPMERQCDRFPFEMNSTSNTMPIKETSGIAELERVFGSNADQRTSIPLNQESKLCNKVNVVEDNNDCLSEENSDVDCG